MESKKAKARPVAAPAPAIVKIEWWNRPVTWAIGGLIVLFALVGFLSPDRTPASQQQPMMTVPSAKAEEVYQRTPLTGTPTAEVGENNGTVNVQDGQAIVDTNHGTVNIGTVNIGRPDTASVTRVIEKIVERPVYVEQAPVVVHHYVTIPRDTNPRCEGLAKEHEARVASWYANANQ